MDIISWLYFKRKPRQWVYLADHSLIIFKKKNPFAESTQIGRHIALEQLLSEDGASIASELDQVDTGLVFASKYVVFNLFDFEKLPFWQSQLQDLVEWRLGKVFPEKLEMYFHRCIRLKQRHVFSLLMEKDLVQRSTAFFKNLQIPIVSIGCSAIEIMNACQKQKKTIDLIIEADRNLLTVIVLKLHQPCYVRKIHFSDAAEAVTALEKTMLYIRKNISHSFARSVLVRAVVDDDCNALVNWLYQQDISCQVWDLKKIWLDKQ
jgi:hypothetical protein